MSTNRDSEAECPSGHSLPLLVGGRSPFHSGPRKTIVPRTMCAPQTPGTSPVGAGLRVRAGRFFNHDYFCVSSIFCLACSFFFLLFCLLSGESQDCLNVLSGNGIFLHLFLCFTIPGICRFLLRTAHLWTNRGPRTRINIGIKTAKLRGDDDLYLLCRKYTSTCEYFKYHQGHECNEGKNAYIRNNLS